MITRGLQFYRNSFGGLSKEVWLLSTVMLINRCGTMVLPFLSLYLTRALDFSMTQAGIVMSCYGAGSVMGSFIGGQLSDRIGYYDVIFWSLFSTGVSFMGLQLVTGFFPICLYVFCLTTIADTIRPASFIAIARYSRPENLTRSISLLRLAINLGMALGPALGGWLIATYGYYWLFWIDGFTCVFAALAFRFCLRNAAAPTEESPNTQAKPTGASSPYRDGVYLFFLLMNMLVAIAFMQIFSATPVFFREELALSENLIGLLFAINCLIIVVIEMPLVHALENYRAPLRIIMLGTLLIGCSYLIFNVELGISGFSLGLLSMVLITFGEMFNMPFTNTFAMNRASDHNRGRYMALFAISYSVAHIVAPSLSMQLAENWGFEIMWYVMGGFCLLGTIGFWVLEARFKLNRNKIIAASY